MKTKSILTLTTTLALMTFASSAVAAAGVGKTCGGFAGLQCNPGQFCQHKAGACFIFDITGTCVKVPRFCFKIFRPVCGCDGKTYGNDCEREAAMVSKSHNGKCT